MSVLAGMFSFMQRGDNHHQPFHTHGKWLAFLFLLIGSTVSRSSCWLATSVLIEFAEGSIVNEPLKKRQGPVMPLMPTTKPLGKQVEFFFKKNLLQTSAEDLPQTSVTEDNSSSRKCQAEIHSNSAAFKTLSWRCWGLNLGSFICDHDLH